MQFSPASCLFIPLWSGKVILVVIHFPTVKTNTNSANISNCGAGRKMEFHRHNYSSKNIVNSVFGDGIYWILRRRNYKHLQHPKDQCNYNTQNKAALLLILVQQFS
jgi:hypothetical protein